MPLLRTPKKLSVLLSPEEMTRLIEAAPNRLYRMLVTLLYNTGCPINEANVQDYVRQIALSAICGERG